jgi:DNA primase
LCFDGDAAGRRAAYRAVDLALPMLAPGKSLRFATLPEGQDPDDLIRNGGAEAMREVLASARPLAEVLWLRESESANLETPERRAALEARLGEVLRMIGDETVRRYYRDDLKARLAQLFQQSDTRPPDRFRSWRGPRTGLPQPKAALTPRSARLAQSSIVRGARSGVPAREALMLLAVLNHPWLLADHAEELAELDLSQGDADHLRRALLHAVAGSGAELSVFLEGAEAIALRQRMERAISHGGDWEARPDAAREDVIAWWRQIVSLHRKKRTLSKELLEAERALGAEPTEANFAWLKDVQQRLAVLDGTEVQIEGFGAPSGRPARTM